MNVPRCDVFICYETTTGLGFARHLKKALEKTNRSAFVAEDDIPRANPKGKTWKLHVDAAIEGCKYFVVIITRLALDSDEVKREIELAASLDKMFLACRYDGVDRALVSRLRVVGELQHIDFASEYWLANKVLEELWKRENPGTFVNGMASQAAALPLPVTDPALQELLGLVKEGKADRAIRKARALLTSIKGLAARLSRPKELERQINAVLAMAFLLKGDDKLHAKSYRPAEGLYRQALRHAQASDEKGLTAICYFELGAAVGLQERHNAALRCFNECLRLRPGYAEAYTNRGVAYGHKGEYDKEIADYNEAIRLRPDLAEAYNNRGVAYGHKGEYDKAVADFNEALRLRPDFAKAYNNRGCAYFDKGGHARAMADYNQAIRLRPGLAEAYNNRGVAYVHKKEYDKAIADYTEAIRLRPGYAEAYYNRGVAYVHKKEYDKAIADYTEAIRLRPDQPEAYSNRGTAHVLKKDYDTAIADYDEAIRLRPHLAEACAGLGAAHALKGDNVAAACRALEKAWALRERLPDKGEDVRKLMEELKCSELGE